MKFYELEKEALSLSEVERQHLINTLMASLSVNGRRASFGCMEGTREIIEDIVEPALSITEWEVMSADFACQSYELFMAANNKLEA